MMAARPGRWLVFAAMVAVAGCSPADTIRVHDEAPPTRPDASPLPASQKQFRTLAAMVPSDTGKEPTWWFFKMSGPAAVIAKYEGDFDKLLDTIQARPDDNDPIGWVLPAGWTQSEKTPASMRFATLKSPGGEVEIAVTRFGGSVLANAQRWWGELWGKDKQQDFTMAMMPDHVQQRAVHGRLVLRVDMSGPNEPSKRPAMGPHGAMNPHGGMEK